MNWKLLKDSVPFLTVLLSLLVKIYQNIYYQSFGVRISQFLEIQELLLIISDKLLIVLSTILIYSLMILNINTYDDNPLKNKDTSYQRFKSPSYIATYLGLAFGIATYFRQNTFSMHFFSGLIIVAVIITLIFKEIRVYNLKENKKEFSPLVFQFFFMLLSVIIMLGLILLSDVGTVKSGKYYGTKIITADSTYQSDSSCYYIGKTEIFVFIYNENTQLSTVLPMESIKRIELKENKIKKIKE